MITINKAPGLNRILLDSNNTVVSITSSHGAGYYFRAKIYIDDELFDTQSWSRKDLYTAEKDLKKLYSAYFTPEFNSTFTPGLSSYNSLTKKVSIIIEEYQLSDDTLDSSITLPDFYIMYNVKPVIFSENQKLVFLGIEPDKLLISDVSKIRIPFFANTEDESIVVTLLDSFDNEVDSQEIATGTAKGAYVYQFDLGAYSFPLNLTHFTLSIVVGSTTITKVFRYNQLPDYPIKEVVFQNNFGFYIYAYFDGAFALDKSLDINTYEQFDGSEKIFEINEEHTYSINSGSLLNSEKMILEQVLASLDAKLLFNNECIDMVSKTKKVVLSKDRQTNYSENLVFTARKNTSIDNVLNVITVTPTLEITSVTTENGSDYEVAFTSNFEYSQLFSQIKPSTTWSSSTLFSGLTSPQMRIVSLGGAGFLIRIFAIIDGESIYSNEYTVPSWP